MEDKYGAIILSGDVGCHFQRIHRAVIESHRAQDPAKRERHYFLSFPATQSDQIRQDAIIDKLIRGNGAAHTWILCVKLHTPLSRGLALFDAVSIKAQRTLDGNRRCGQLGISYVGNVEARK
jgi:hypothetical protein